MSSIDVHEHNREDLDDALQAAVPKAIGKALSFPGKGILVTRHNYNSYSVKLTHGVPFGTTRERDLLLPNAASQTLTQGPSSLAGHG